MHQQGQENVSPDEDRYRQERDSDHRDWLSIDFWHYLDLVHFKVIPAYAFVIHSREPVKAKETYSRLKVVLDKTPIEIVKITNLPRDH